MPREPRMKLEKPSERIKDIARGYVSDYPEAIMIFLDEQYEREYCNEENCTAKDDLIPHEHVFEEGLLSVDTGVPGGDKTAKIYGVKKEDGTIHISRIDYEEPVSERNALIDELVQEVLQQKVTLRDRSDHLPRVDDFLKGKNEARDEFVELLISKKK